MKTNETTQTDTIDSVHYNKQSIDLLIPDYVVMQFKNVAREACISPKSAIATALSALAYNPALLQDVLDESDFYMHRLRNKGAV